MVVLSLCLFAGIFILGFVIRHLYLQRLLCPLCRGPLKLVPYEVPRSEASTQLVAEVKQYQCAFCGHRHRQ